MLKGILAWKTATKFARKLHDSYLFQVTIIRSFGRRP